MLQQIEASAVDGFLGDNMSAVRRERFNGVGDGRRPGGHRQRRASALQRRHPFFKHVLGGIGQPPVDIPGIRQAEAVRGMLTVSENIGCGLINRDGPGIGCRIGGFLAYVKLQRFEFILTHFSLSFSFHCLIP